MMYLWGERNIARLARESGVPRESVSKILSYKRGIGDEVAEKLAGPLELTASDLVPPATEAVSLVSLDRRLEGLEELVRDSGKDVTRAIRALTRAIERLERRLDDEAPPATEVGR